MSYGFEYGNSGFGGGFNPMEGYGAGGGDGAGYGGGGFGFGDMGGGFMGGAEEQKKSGEKKVGHHQPKLLLRWSCDADPVAAS